MREDFNVTLTRVRFNRMVEHDPLLQSLRADSVRIIAFDGRSVQWHTQPLPTDHPEI